jgi:CheY-like chemotaxis protein
LARSQRLDSIGQLVAGIAHDFNNLLTVTKLAVSWLRVDEKEAERRDALAQISSVTDSAIDLIKNLLGFARRGRQVAAPVSLDAAMKPVLEMASRTFDPAIVLDTDLATNGAMVMGDSSQLEHMAMNLVINARDAVAGAGSVTVRTRTRTIAADGDQPGAVPAGHYVVLDVIDTGVGIDPAIRDRIFEPYFTTKTQGTVKGTGLGLSLVHGIVEGHLGFIEVLDNDPKGTIVRVLLPAPPAIAEAGAPHPNDAMSSSAGPLPRGGHRLILVVDDESLVRASTAASLRALDFRVCEVADGASAIALFRERHGEIAGVVLDMVMPGLRGRDVYTALREIQPDVRVLLVTGTSLDAEVQGVLDLGVGGWLQKPYDDRQLVTALRRIGAF